ncbi:MAG: CbiM family transporter [Gemmataceae bacterium]
MPLWAVHISDGVLSVPFWAAGWLVAAMLLAWGCRRVTEEEIPRVALVTAAFFVASTIHVKVPPSTVHLLLNGLAGILVGRRAVLAIFVGLGLQAILLGHGGFYVLGVNTCVMALPALLAWLAFGRLHAMVRRGPLLASLLLAGSCAALVLAGAFSIAMIRIGLPLSASADAIRAALLEAAAETLGPWTVAGAGLCAGAAVLLERRFRAAPDLAAGFALGSLTVLATGALGCLALFAGGAEIWEAAPWAMIVLHVPIAVIEGLIVGVSVSFLARVKPELLGLDRVEPARRPRETAVDATGVLVSAETAAEPAEVK